MKTTSGFDLLPCPSSLSSDQIKQLKRDGYLAFSDVLSSDEVKRSRDAMTRLTQEFAFGSNSTYTPPQDPSGSGVHGGGNYKRKDSDSRMQLEPGFDPAGKSIEEIEANVRKFMWFYEEDAVFQEMVSSSSRIGGVVASILGSDPVLFQQMALVKPPFIGSEKPWHQDNAYFMVSPLNAVLGVWIALDDAEVENGCMHVIPGGHLEGAFKHHHGMDCEIDAELLPTDRAVPVPIPVGGAMFFYGMLPHETPPNRSPLRRRALQYHFRGADTQIVDEEAYNRIFVDREGKPSSCRVAVKLDL